MTGPVLRPPSGGDDAPRFSSPLSGGQVLALEALASRICRQYRGEFPDELQRYGTAGDAWCVHDNQHLLNWAVEAVVSDLDMLAEVAWLANILDAREFPTDRLARSLDIGASVIRDELAGDLGTELATVLADAATFVRSGDFIDYPSQEN